MSDAGDTPRGKRPPVTPAAEDPWAKWRKPDAATQAAVEAAPTVDREKAPKSKKAEQPKASPVAEPAVATAEEPRVVDLGGTLGVRNKPTADGVRKRPVRGGALPRKPLPPRVAPAVPVAEPNRAEGQARTTPRPAAGKSAGERAKPFGKPGATGSGGKPVWNAPKPAKPQVAKPVSAPAASTAKAADAPSGVRLSKVMSERGLCSRREADLWIERGWVYVDGQQISELGTRIDPAAEITVSKEAVKDQAKAVTILLHKPVGYVSGQPEPDCVPAVTLITAENQLPNSGGPEFKPWMLRGLAPAGRLDVDSTGLLVLTSDGRVAKKLIGEDSDAEKEYLVRVSGRMIEGGLDLLRHGLELDGKALKPAWVKQLNEDQLHFILKEGKKRQIRRMCELVGLRVIGLKRVRIGRIRLGDLPMGQWRFLREGEAF